jgi:tetratricopeptide (TPR) repeat protein
MPAFRAARNNLARVYLALDRPNDAMSCFRALVELGQADHDTFLLLGHSLLLQDQPVSAEGAYRQALMLDPGDPDTLRGLIKCLIAQERNAEVLALTRELQRQFPIDAELWNLRANAHLALDQPDAAIAAIETARLLGAASPPLLAMLGDLYLNREQPEDAVEAYRGAFAGARPSTAQMLQAARGLLFYGAVDEAEQITGRLLSEERKSTLSADQRIQAQHLQARVAVLREQSEVAMQIYEDLLKEDPLNGEALLSLANLHADAGKADEARMSLERAARIEGHEVRALVRQAQLEVEAGRFADAVPLLESAQAFRDQPHVARYLEQVRRLAAR